MNSPLLTDAQLDMLESEYSCGHGFGLVPKLFAHARAANEDLSELIAAENAEREGEGGAA